MTDCDHDYRVDPRVQLPTWPPQNRLVCVNCGHMKGRPILGTVVNSRDPRDWPRAQS